MQPLELLENAVKILDKKNGINLKALEVADLTSVADYFVTVSGTSSTHVKALAETLEEEMTKLGVEPAHVEGKSTGWILLDYLSVVVHVFTPEERERINMEKLWGDAKEVDLSAWLTD